MGTMWTREQEEELAELFQRYKGEEGKLRETDTHAHHLVHVQTCCGHWVSLTRADMIGCIVAALEGGEVKRSRKQIINQLVKQELVEDRKQLYKKSTKKKKVPVPHTRV